MSQDRDKSLLKAVEFGRGARVRRLVTDGLANVNTEDESGKPAIFMAVENGNTEIAKLLLETGADVDTYFDDCSLIHIAIRNGQKKMIQLLLDHSVNLNDKSKNLYDFAMQLNHQEIGKMIVDAALAGFAKNKLDDCLICCNPRREIFAFDCGHAKLCEMCCLKIMSENYPKCPECREEVKKYSRIFFN